ncbi:hypothetical protein CP061683_0588A, partial [Chlamydia psittaci 06-1683]
MTTGALLSATLS